MKLKNYKENILIVFIKKNMHIRTCIVQTPVQGSTVYDKMVEFVYNLVIGVVNLLAPELKCPSLLGYDENRLNLTFCQTHVNGILVF